MKYTSAAAMMIPRFAAPLLRPQRKRFLRAKKGRFNVIGLAKAARGWQGGLSPRKRRISTPPQRPNAYFGAAAAQKWLAFRTLEPVGALFLLRRFSRVSGGWRQLAQKFALPSPYASSSPMPYVSRAAVPTACAYCGVCFAAPHLRRKYGCNSCNMLAARAHQRAGAPARPAPPRAVPTPVAIQPLAALSLLEQLRALGHTVTPVAPPEPIGARTPERIHPLIPVQLHVISRAVRLAENGGPGAAGGS